MTNIKIADLKQNISVVWCRRRKVEHPNPCKFASFSATTVRLGYFSANGFQQRF